MKRILSLLLLGTSALLAMPAFAALHPVPLGKKQATVAPWTLLGQFLFYSGKDQYVGSGVTLHPKSVITAGHNIYDPEAGWSTRMVFNRNNFGTTAAKSVTAAHLYLLGGYQSAVTTFGPDDVRSFAYDTAGVTFATPVVAKGGIPYASNPVLLKGAYPQVCIGYGAEGAHDGDHMLIVRPTGAFRSTYGSFYENYSIYIEGGMSGGPLLASYNYSYFLTGIIVSSSEKPESGGVRIIDATTVNFIKTYLKN